MQDRPQPAIVLAARQDPFVVRQTSAPEPVEKQPAGPFSSPGAVTAWALAIAVLAAALGAIGYVTADRLQTDMLVRSSDARAWAVINDVWPNEASGSYYEALGEWAELLEPDNRDLALLAAEKAIDADPDRAFAWARIAYFSTTGDGQVSEQGVNALRASMERCPLCDPALIRWRLNFVLSHWDQMPEDIRQNAFTHADMLRWNGANAEFLAEMRVKSRSAGIPFDAYRAAVETPVRSLDIATPEGA